MEEKIVYDPTADRSKKVENPGTAEKPKKAKKDPHVRPLILSHKTILVTIPADIRDKLHLSEAKEQGIKVRFSCDSKEGIITIKLLGEPKIAEREAEK